MNAPAHTIADDFEARLMNWARWARDSKQSVGHCSSIEHRYRSPQCWDAPEARIDLFLHDAVVVEKVIRQLPIEWQKPFVLHLTWFGGKTDQLGAIPQDVRWIITRYIAKHYKIGINVNQLQDRLNDARAMIRNKLR